MLNVNPSSTIAVVLDGTVLLTQTETKSFGRRSQRKSDGSSENVMRFGGVVLLSIISETKFIGDPFISLSK